MESCEGLKSGSKAAALHSAILCGTYYHENPEGVTLSIDAIKTVAVLGAGTMGNGIAHVFARAGYNVILRDVEPRFLERGLETIGKNLDREIKKGKLAEGEKGTVLGRVKCVTEMV